MTKKRTKKEAAFQKEVSRLNHWILYCKQNIEKNDKFMNWNQSLNEAISERMKLLQEYATNKLND